MIQYLERQPEHDAFQMSDDDETHAAMAVCVRWGSYFAVLSNPDLPLWPEIRRRSVNLSRIEDDEMARMNIEITAGLAHWLGIRREDPVRYRHLVQAARQLPMPQPLVSFRNEIKATIEAVARTRSILGQATAAKEAVQHTPDRVLANALVYSFWRNNSDLEDIHAGISRPLPLNQRRITPAEEKRLMQGLATAYSFFSYLPKQVAEIGMQASWPKQVALLLEMMHYPYDWSIDAVTGPIELWGSEP